MRSPNIDWETRLGYPLRIVVGVDEVGRGCLAGPVAAGALVLPPSLDFDSYPWIAEISDSKELTAVQRERLAPLIGDWALASSVGFASVEEIDEINIYHAAHLAMTRAVDGVAKLLSKSKSSISHILIDGNAIPRAYKEETRFGSTAVVKGDLKCLSIAAASILAKVERDRLMTEMDAAYPGYGFAVHKGYGTPKHGEALKRLGACPIHRRSFAPVAAVLGLR
ncbi:MAG: ribonuclease HII [Oligoflexia bacterium]|nr:ribonuclease HII [Oligoflexia bacterium]